MTFTENLGKLEVSNAVPAEGDSCKVIGYGASISSTMPTPGVLSHYLEVVIKKSETCSATTRQICAGADDADSDMSKTLCTVG